MKRSILGAMTLLAGAFVAHGQGSVAFANYGALSTYIYVSYKPSQGAAGTLIGGSSGPAATLSNYGSEIANGADWTVQLYGAVGSGLASSSLSPLSGITAALESGSSQDSDAGTWSSTAIASFPSAPNGTVATLQLFAWYNAGGTVTSYNQAFSENLPVGSDSPVNVTLGAPPAPASFLPALGSFSIIAQTPEPSTIALGVIGASAFLMRLRRKQ